MAIDPLSASLDLINTGLTFYNNYQNREFAREQASTAYNRQIDMFNRQNAYNTPAAQMSRFVEAGLNPNLAYGQLQNGLSAPGVPQGQAPSQPAPQLLLQNAMAAKQMQSMDIKNNLDTQRLESDMKESLNRMGVNDANAQYLASLNSTVPVSIAHMEQQISLMNYQQRSLGWDICTKSLLQSDVLAQYRTDLNKSKVELDYLGKFYTAQIFGLNSQAKSALSQARLNNEQADVAKAVAALYRSQTSSIDSFNKGYYKTVIQGNYGNFTPFQADLVAGYNRAAYQTKITDLITKYGDSQSVMSLIKIGFDCAESVGSVIGNIGGFRLDNAKRGKTLGIW